MSLKAFHLVLVLAAILAASAYGMWCVAAALRGESARLLPGLLCAGGGMALVVHGIRFYKQTEKDPWL